MAVKTLIAWTDHTFNIAWGCTKISPGCANCYADGNASRWGHDVWGGRPRRLFGAKHWAEPLKWQEAARRDGVRRRVFCSSMCDNFEDHPAIDAQRLKLWPLIRETPDLDWLLLTKRSERVAANLPGDWGDGWPNVWLGVSVENQDYVHRIDHLGEIPAAVRFVSGEPLLGPLDLRGRINKIDWLIVGGESGPKHRPMPHEWARDLRDQCGAAGVSFFFKQSSAIRTEMGIELDGEVVREFPTPRITTGGGGAHDPFAFALSSSAR